MILPSFQWLHWTGSSDGDFSSKWGWKGAVFNRCLYYIYLYSPTFLLLCHPWSSDLITFPTFNGFLLGPSRLRWRRGSPNGSHFQLDPGPWRNQLAASSGPFVHTKPTKIYKNDLKSEVQTFPNWFKQWYIVIKRTVFITKYLIFNRSL